MRLVECVNDDWSGDERFMPPIPPKVGQRFEVDGHVVVNGDQYYHLSEYPGSMYWLCECFRELETLPDKELEILLEETLIEKV